MDHWSRNGGCAQKIPAASRTPAEWSARSVNTVPAVDCRSFRSDASGNPNAVSSGLHAGGPRFEHSRAGQCVPASQKRTAPERRFRERRPGTAFQQRRWDGVRTGTRPNPAIAFSRTCSALSRQPADRARTGPGYRDHRPEALQPERGDVCADRGSADRSGECPRDGCNR